MDRIVLKGITWDHSRGITPLLAAAQRFSEIYPQAEIIWKKRTLQEFADYPVEELATDYDLLIIDHPSVGCAAKKECVLPLDEYLPSAFLKEQLESTVGLSHLSYYYDQHQWALAIDAAAPVACYRSDLLEMHDIQVPDTWNEVVALAKDGKVAVPSIPIDLLMNFYMFCIAHGSEPFPDEEKVIDKETGLKALDSMRELWSVVDEEVFHHNPITIAEIMSSSDKYWYCPFGYGYSNYARKGYAKHILTYTDIVQFGENNRLRSTLGGTGISISQSSENIEWALKFCEWVLSPGIQSTLYVQHGGQPGHRSAWIDDEANRNCNNFFRNTLATLDRSYVRPRYDGYLAFQKQAGIPLQEYLRKGGSAEIVLDKMNEIYRRSRVVQKTQI